VRVGSQETKLDELVYLRLSVAGGGSMAIDESRDLGK
jgi:hypothetical protein